jgi:hypothetical protein
VWVNSIFEMVSDKCLGNNNNMYNIYACVRFIIKLLEESHIQGDSYFCSRFQGSALHSGLYTAICETHTNFYSELISLLTSNVPDEVVTIHRSQEV